ncbi:MAG: hypothetical protein WB756_15415, partial [Xanthobacteraceae bacterium]
RDGSVNVEQGAIGIKHENRHGGLLAHVPEKWLPVFRKGRARLKRMRLWILSAFGARAGPPCACQKGFSKKR